MVVETFQGGVESTQVFLQRADVTEHFLVLLLLLGTSVSSEGE